MDSPTMGGEESTIEETRRAVLLGRELVPRVGSCKERIVGEGRLKAGGRRVSRCGRCSGCWWRQADRRSRVEKETGDVRIRD